MIIGGAILSLLTILNLLRTACSDPGIIPRATHSEAADTEAQIKAHEQQTGQLNKPRIKIGNKKIGILTFPTGISRYCGK